MIKMIKENLVFKNKFYKLQATITGKLEHDILLKGEPILFIKLILVSLFRFSIEFGIVVKSLSSK